MLVSWFSSGLLLAHQLDRGARIDHETVNHRTALHCRTRMFLTPFGGFTSLEHV
jgi:hypothetical protein